MRKNDDKTQKKQQLRYYQEMYIDDGLSIVGNRIAAIRKEKGMSQAELARRLLINSTYLYRVESQQCNMSIDLLIATARILGVGLDDLIAAPVPMSIRAQAEIDALRMERDKLRDKLAKIKELADD